MVTLDLTSPRGPRFQGTEEFASVAGGEVAAFEAGDGAARAIGIGVATGALTFLVTRMLEQWLFPRRGS